MLVSSESDKLLDEWDGNTFGSSFISKLLACKLARSANDKASVDVSISSVPPPFTVASSLIAAGDDELARCILARSLSDSSDRDTSVSLHWAWPH